MSDTDNSPEIDSRSMELTVNIVAAYVGNHQIASDDVPKLIRDVHSSLTGLGGQELIEAEPEKPQKPAVPIKKSVHDDYIVCLEDGKQFKTLKRHLQSQYGMTIEEYKAKWNLPADYPTTAPSYSRLRSQSAKKNGLGRARAD